MSDENVESAWPPRPRPGACNVRILVQDAVLLTSEVVLPCVDWDAAIKVQEEIRQRLAASPGTPVMDPPAQDPVSARGCPVCHAARGEPCKWDGHWAKGLLRGYVHLGRASPTPPVCGRCGGTGYVGFAVRADPVIFQGGIVRGDGPCPTCTPKPQGEP